METGKMNYQLVDALRKDFKPDAEKFLAELKEKKLKTTKDGYGTVMTAITPLPREAQLAFIGAMADAGWNPVTAAALTNVMGLA